LPASLPQHRVEIDVPEADKQCACGHAKQRIGESVSEKLEYLPASLRVIQTARVKYACPRCHDGVTEAPAPPQVVEKSLAGEGLLTHVVVSKYVDHLPLYRLEGILGRHGLAISRTTLCGWVGAVAAALAPIADELRRQVLATNYLQTDDTTVTILARGFVQRVLRAPPLRPSRAPRPISATPRRHAKNALPSQTLSAPHLL